MRSGRSAHACETDINLDADGNGKISAKTCLDVSMYGFAPVAEGRVTLSQTAAPANSRFGTIRFTPASTDDMALLSAGAGTIKLNTRSDTQVNNPPLPLAEYNDDVVVVHVYNFQNTSGMPNTAMAEPTGSTPFAALSLLGLALLSVAGVGTLAIQRAKR